MARELSRGGLPGRFGADHISVVDEQGMVVYTVLLRAVLPIALLLRVGVLVELFC